MRSSTFRLSLVTSLFALVLPVMGQETRGTITGTITDQQGDEAEPLQDGPGGPGDSVGPAEVEHGEAGDDTDPAEQGGFIAGHGVLRIGQRGGTPCQRITPGTGPRFPDSVDTGQRGD